MKPYLSSVGIVFLVTLAILAWPRQAHAVQLAQVYNYAAGAGHPDRWARRSPGC